MAKSYMAVLIHLLIVAVGISLIAAVPDQTNGSIPLENDILSTQYHENCTASLHIRVAFEVLNQTILLSTSPLFAMFRPELFSALQYHLLGPKSACDIFGLPYTYCVRDCSCEVNLTTTDYMTLVQKPSGNSEKEYYRIVLPTKSILPETVFYSTLVLLVCVLSIPLCILWQYMYSSGLRKSSLHSSVHVMLTAWNAAVFGSDIGVITSQAFRHGHQQTELYNLLAYFTKFSLVIIQLFIACSFSLKGTKLHAFVLWNVLLFLQTIIFSFFASIPECNVFITTAILEGKLMGLYILMLLHNKLISCMNNTDYLHRYCVRIVSFCTVLVLVALLWAYMIVSQLAWPFL